MKTLSYNCFVTVLLWLSFTSPTVAQTYLVLTNFTGTNGATPWGGMAVSGGALYGTTYAGGASNRGTIFQLNTDGSGLTTLKDFTSSTDGMNPLGTLTLGGGALFGTTYNGGQSNSFYTTPVGTVFRLSTNGGGFKVLRQFNHVVNGANPRGGLLVTNGFVFGTTENGGWGNGVIFRVRTNGGGFRMLKRFTGYQGDAPNPGLVMADKRLYGTAESGGLGGFGTLFRMNQGGGQPYVLKDFGTSRAPARNPSTGLIWDGSRFLGTTEFGNSPIAPGTLFSATKNARRYSGGLSSLANLPLAGADLTRIVKVGTLLYGTTYNGGNGGVGTIFRVKADGTGYTVLHHFSPATGGNPRGDLVYSGGRLYGTTTTGGPYNKGVVFAFSFSSSAPVITSEPSSVAAAAGTTVSFNVSAIGTATLKYQWWKSGSPLSGKTASSLAIPNAQAGDAANYFVVVTNNYGRATSSVVTLTVIASNAPAITMQPHDAIGYLGQGVSFTVAAAGLALKYQWWFEDAVIAGATNASFNRSSVATNHEGDYFVVITNTSGSVTSEVATLTVVASNAPAITTQPKGSTNFVGHGVLLAVTATSISPLTFQWFKDGDPIPGATNANYFLPSVQTDDDGDYYVAVSNAYGSVNSSEVTVTVLEADAPVITAQPQSLANGAGGPASFTVMALGTKPFTYQWWKGPSSVSNQTNNVLSFSAIQAGDAGDYFVVITNDFGSATSVIATLTVLSSNAPTITAQPQSVIRYVGQNVSFSVTAGGTAPLGYQWLKNGGSLNAATNSSYSITGVQLGDAGDFSVLITNVAGSVASAVATLTVLASNAPAITLQPHGATNYVGQSVLLNVAATGTAPLNFQWFKDGSPISGATAASLYLPAVQAGDDGDYYVAVMNQFGSVSSAVATVRVLTADAPVITAQPASLARAAGSSASFSVTAIGTDPLAYQWQKNGSSIAGQTGTNYTIASAQATNAANYTVVVTNAFGSVTSAVATLTVLPANAPVINSQPQNAFSAVNGSASFSVAATGSPTLTYQWWKNGSPVGGQTATNYSQGGLQTGDAGNYFVVVANPFGSVTSSVVTLTVLSADAPVIVAQPHSITTPTGSNISLTVTATGGQPLRYQWWLDEAPLDGATNAIYNISNVQTNHEGEYFVVISNASGSATSEVASVTVLTSLLEITFQPQDSTNTMGTAATFTVATDGVEPMSYQWWKSPGTLLAGKTDDNLSLTSLELDDAGGYYVVITNSYGSVTSVVATLTVLPTPPLTYVWISNADGDWDDAYNWSPVGIPGASDTVTIALPYKVTLVEDVTTVSNLTLSSATLLGDPLQVRGMMTWTSGTVSNALIVKSNAVLNWANGNLYGALLVASNGVANWGGGSLDGALTVASGGTLTISNTVSLGLNFGNYYGGGSLTNNGTVVWAGTIYGYGGGLIHNAGLWQDVGDLSLGDGIGGNLTNTFINTGTFQKTGGTGSSTILWLFNTTGTVNTDNGALNISKWTDASTLNGLMNLSGGTMNTQLTVASGALLNWSAGDLTGWLTVAAGGTLTISNTVSLGLNFGNYYGGGSLTNNGTVLWTGTIYGYGGGLIHNAGLWQDVGDLSLGDGIGGNLTNTFINTGTFQKTTGVGTTTLLWRFNTTGTVNTTTGSLNIVKWTGVSTLNGLMNLAGGTMNAPLTVASSAILNWLAGDLTGWLTVAAGGTVTISNTVSLGLNYGNYYGGGSLTNNGTVVWAGTIYGYGGGLIHNAGLWQDVGDLSLGHGIGGNLTNTFINTGTFQKTAGVGTTTLLWLFNTTGTVDATNGAVFANWTGANLFHGKMNWSGGTMDGPMNLATDAAFTWSGGSVKSALTTAGGSTLNWSGGYLDGVLTVGAGGTLTISNTVSLGYNSGNYYGGGSLTNNGSVLWAGTIYGYGGGLIHNAGLWQDVGDLTLGDGIGSITNTFINTGSFQKTGGGGTPTILQWRFNTTGTVNTTTGSLNIPKWTGVNTLNGLMNLAGGTMNAPLTVASGAVLNWSSGDLYGPLTVAAGGMLTISNSVSVGHNYGNYYGGGSLTNNGTVLWAGTIYGYGGGLIHNAGLWQDLGDYVLGDGIGAITNTFINTGTFQKIAGSGSTTVQWPFTTSGTTEIRIGTLSLSKTATQNGGSTLVRGGDLTVSQPFQLLGGVLGGTNAINGAVANSGGTVSPGLSPGKLTINGNYTQTPPGALLIELAGTTQATTYDWLSVNGTAQLGGTLRVTLTNNFVPPTNSSYQFLTATTRNGNFANFYYPSNLAAVQVNYAANSATLQVTNILASVTPFSTNAPTATSGSFSAGFSGVAGATYVIEYSDTFLPFNWQPLTNIVATSVGAVNFHDLLVQPERFYRAYYLGY